MCLTVSCTGRVRRTTSISIYIFKVIIYSIDHNHNYDNRRMGTHNYNTRTKINFYLSYNRLKNLKITLTTMALNFLITPDYLKKKKKKTNEPLPNTTKRLLTENPPNKISEFYELNNRRSSSRLIDAA